MNKLKLIHGDCLVEMQKIPDKSIDMILCDLPYGVLNKGNDMAGWDQKLPLEDLWSQYNRIIKDNGAIVLFAQGMFTAELMVSNRNMWRYNLVWDKMLSTGFLNANRMPLRSHEDICIFYKKMPVYNPQMTEGKPLHARGEKWKEKEQVNNCYGKRDGVVADVTLKEKFPTSLLRFQKPHPSAAVHPTQKPVELCEWLIKTFTNEGDKVLDNCMGSGSTMVACANTKREGIGIEIEKEFFDIARERVMAAAQKYDIMLKEVVAGGVLKMEEHHEQENTFIATWMDHRVAEASIHGEGKIKIKLYHPNQEGYVSTESDNLDSAWKHIQDYTLTTFNDKLNEDCEHKCTLRI